MHEYKVIAQIQAENNKLRAQLARLDDVEGLAEVLAPFLNMDKISKHFKVKPTEPFDVEQKLVAQAVINYIKGGGRRQ